MKLDYSTLCAIPFVSYFGIVFNSSIGRGRVKWPAAPADTPIRHGSCQSEREAAVDAPIQYQDNDLDILRDFFLPRHSFSFA